MTVQNPITFTSCHSVDPPVSLSSTQSAIHLDQFSPGSQSTIHSSILSSSHATQSPSHLYIQPLNKRGRTNWLSTKMRENSPRCNFPTAGHASHDQPPGTTSPLTGDERPFTRWLRGSCSLKGPLPSDRENDGEKIYITHANHFIIYIHQSIYAQFIHHQFFGWTEWMRIEWLDIKVTGWLGLCMGGVTG